MLLCCANPECQRPFRLLHSGRIYRFDCDRRHDHQDMLWEMDNQPPYEHYWLCEDCCHKFVLIKTPGSGVRMRRANVKAS